MNAAEPNAACARRTLLVVDDDRDLADTLKALLEQSGYTVHVANSGTAAMEAVNDTDFDAIVCDMMLRDMRGDEFFHSAIAEKPELAERFIFSTGHSDHPRVMEFLEAHDARILFKPFGEQELLRSVQAASEN